MNEISSFSKCLVYIIWGKFEPILHISYLLHKAERPKDGSEMIFLPERERIISDTEKREFSRPDYL